MTKSFTAATLLLLRDEGRLQLDDPVATYAPELAGWAPSTADSGPITVRQLLTMSAGLPTDDPWGDREQDLTARQFAELLVPGSDLRLDAGDNLRLLQPGYGILGRVITNVAGAQYRDVVRDRLLVSLGMTSTFLEEEVPEARLAHGYIRPGTRWSARGGTPTACCVDGRGVLHRARPRDLGRLIPDAFPARFDPVGPTRCGERPGARCSSSTAISRPMSSTTAPIRAGGLAGGYVYGLFVAVAAASARSCPIRGYRDSGPTCPGIRRRASA